MNKKKHSNLKWFTKVGILLLYACFFSVQLSYTHDTANLFSHSFITSSTNKNIASVIKSATNSNDKKVNVRLNKRFQPVSFTLGSIFSITPPTKYAVVKSRIYYTDPTLPSVHFTISSLRGPPAVA